MSLGNSSFDPGRGAAARSDDASDIEVARVLESYLAVVEAGQPANPQQMLEDHPHLADRLRACLRVLQVAEQAAQDVTGPPQAAQPGSDRTAPPRPRRSKMGLSSLSTLDFGPGEPPQVWLRELPDELEPLSNPRSAAMPHNGASVGRFQLQGEIARGGMGAVLKGRDVDLGRDLAIKVLLESHQRNPDVVRRFVEEAQIGGQLQHPGIVPVYELGTFPDRRPYFAMKLVKGRTLASLLQERTDPAQDRPRFLGIFEQVCQTMAYAHARGVIHRDLKPSNLMVGSFGEVQVMDWGLAKVLPEGGIADEAKGQPAHETVIMTVRSGSSGSGTESQAGSVLGTPAYMAPEQARGEVERVDERADVFGLGAILCEILTGRPPFSGATREAIRSQAARGDLTGVLGRLDACRAEPELVAIARDCLFGEPEHRPRNASEVARRLTAYLTGVQERLRRVELARVEAQARAEEESKRRTLADELAREAEARAEEARARAAIERSRRRRTAALAASVLIIAGVVGGALAYLARQRTARLMATARVVTEALADAERLRGQAQTAALGDLTKWFEARNAARRARDLLAQGEADDALRQRVTTALVDLEREQAIAQQRAAEVERDRLLLAQLETIRGSRSEHWDPKQTDAEYAAAFRGFAIDLDQLDPQKAGKQIAQRSAPVELASYLDDWALQRRSARDKKDEVPWRRLFAAAQVADPDPWRGALRDQIGRDDREALRRLARDQKTLEVQPARTLALLASALKGGEDQDLADQVLRRAWRLDPGDFWVNFDLGMVHWAVRRYKHPEEAARFLSAAVAIRPRSCAVHNNLGNALRDQGKLQEAIAELRTALRLKPDSPVVHNNLGIALDDQGKVEEVIAELRTALRLDPDNPKAHTDLGNALDAGGKLVEAIAEHREALRLKPDEPAAHNNLGRALARQRKVQEAIAEFREALRLEPDLPEAHANLGIALRSRGEFNQAIAELRHARDLAGTYPRLAQRFGRDLAVTERLASVAARLPMVLAGKVKPADTAESLGFAHLCYYKELHGASARFSAEAFQAQPKLAEDMSAKNRYNAACAAALAGCGQGKDDPPLDEATKAHWRKQALDWLKADLAAWSKVLENGPPQARQSIPQTLQHWKADPDLAGLRDPAALVKLPEEEQKACRALWAEVDALVAKARDGTAP
jgi:serine/threonine-protein kinase